MESPSKTDLRDVSWWMSINYACKPRVPITPTFLKEGCISLVARRRSFRISCKHNWSKCGVTTLTLGSRPRQRHGKVQVGSATWESYLHSRECEGMNPHTPKWTFILGVGILMEFRIFKEVFHGSKFIGIK